LSIGIPVDTPHGFLHHPGLSVWRKHCNVSVVGLDRSGLQILHGDGHLYLSADQVGSPVGTDRHGLWADGNERLTSRSCNLVCGYGWGLLINYYLLLLLRKGLDPGAVWELEGVDFHLRALVIYHSSAGFGTHVAIKV
jgi:hypothetical protein